MILLKSDSNKGGFASHTISRSITFLAIPVIYNLIRDYRKFIAISKGRTVYANEMVDNHGACPYN